MTDEPHITPTDTLNDLDWVCDDGEDRKAFVSFDGSGLCITCANRGVGHMVQVSQDEAMRLARMILGTFMTTMRGEYQATNIEYYTGNQQFWPIGTVKLERLIPLCERDCVALKSVEFSTPFSDNFPHGWDRFDVEMYWRKHAKP